MKISNFKLLTLTLFLTLFCLCGFVIDSPGQTIPLRSCKGANPTVKAAGFTMTQLGGINILTCDGQPVLLNGNNLDGAGTVTSVGLSLPNIFSVANSPVTNAGTLTATLASQAQNFVFAAPSGGSGAPVFRALVAGDLPGLPGSQITSGLIDLARLGTGTPSGSNFLRGDGTWATVGGGTVSSVGLSLPNIFTVSNSPVTGTGTLTAALANQTGNVVFASPANGSSGSPLFRSLVSADIPTLDVAKISGVLPAAQIGNLDTAKITTGVFAPARLGTGTANGSTFLAGDGTYKAPTVSAILPSRAVVGGEVLTDAISGYQLGGCGQPFSVTASISRGVHFYVTAYGGCSVTLNFPLGTNLVLSNGVGYAADADGSSLNIAAGAHIVSDGGGMFYMMTNSGTWSQ